MSDRQVAVISDVHGNRWALEEVLKDIRRRGVQTIVNLGDSFYGPLAPAGTAEILLPLHLPTVRGNEDRLVVEASSPSACSPTLSFVREDLTQEHLDWLVALPLTLTVPPNLWMGHGSPEHDDEYLLQVVGDDGVYHRSADAVMARTASIDQPVVLCGHDHVPRTLRLPSGVLVVNPGSVGLPAYADDAPRPHVMETGTPHARYSLLRRCDHGWRTENLAIAYDWDAAASTALEHDRPDWAGWLRSGRADS
ncbi:MAG: metallophosphoesterase family protein [bacterium]|nr:metallophosphoesterase family protein [bacterium]